MRLIVFVSFILLTIFSSGQNRFAFYAPPFVKVGVDTSEWQIPYEMPYLNYLDKKNKLNNRGELVHKTTGLSIDITTVFLDDRGSSYYQYDDVLACRPVENSIHKSYKTYSNLSSGEYSLTREISPRVLVIIKTNCSDKNIEKLAHLRNFLDDLSIVDPAEIDSVVGYPFPLSGDFQKQRTEIFNDYQIRMSKEDSWYLNQIKKMDSTAIDLYLITERKYNFTYAGIVNAKMKDMSNDFSRDEILACWFSPTLHKPGGILYVKPYFNGLQIGKYAAETYSKAINSKEKYTVFDLDVDENIQNDKGFVMLTNDSIWNLMYAEKDSVLGWKTMDHKGKRGYRKHSSTEKRYSSMYHTNLLLVDITNRGDKFLQIIEYVRKTTNGFEYETLPITSIVDRTNGFAPMVTFSNPKILDEYSQIITTRITYPNTLFMSRNGDNVLPYSHWQSHYINSTEIQSSLLITKSFTGTKCDSKSEIDAILKLIPTSKRLVVSPVMEGDMDQDGNTEVFRVFINNGNVVTAEIYEQSTSGLVKAEFTENWKKYVSAEFRIKSLIELSKMDEIYSIPEEMGIVVEEAEGEIEWEPVVEMPEIVETNYDENKIYEAVEEQAIYPGGLNQMFADISKSLIYPEFESENKIEGTIYLEFIIERDGSISDIKVIRDVFGSPSFSNEAIRAVKRLKKFESSAKINGKPVRSRYTIPIKFHLD